MGYSPCLELDDHGGDNVGRRAQVVALLPVLVGSSLVLVMVIVAWPIGALRRRWAIRDGRRASDPLPWAGRAARIGAVAAVGAVVAQLNDKFVWEILVLINYSLLWYYLNLPHVLLLHLDADEGGAKLTPI